MRSLLVVAVSTAVVATSAASAFAQPGPPSPSTGLPPAFCEGFFEGAQEPSLLPTAGLPARTAKTVCHSFYAIASSSELHDPLWSAEHLTKEMAVGGDAISRIDQGFVKDGAISSADQASDSDYVAPYDRGHMTPANDAPDEASQRDTFMLTNAVPQHKNLNRHLWFYLEASVHQIAEIEGDVYVVTGPIFAKKPPMMNGRVARPKATFKAIYVPSRNLAVGYVATNTSAPTCRAFPITEIIRQSEIDLFPALAKEIKSSSSSYGLPYGVNVKRDGSRQRLPLPDCH
jgi:endonuclease G, mitochondrial